MGASGLDEARDALGEGGGGGAPVLVHGFLCECGDDVVEVELYDEVLLCEAQHVFLADGDEVEGRGCGDGTGVVGMQSEKVLGVDECGGCEGLGDGVAVVVGLSGGVYAATDEDDEMGHGLSLTDDGFSGLGFAEVEPGVGNDFLHVASVDAQEEWQLVELRHFANEKRLMNNDK